MAGGRSGDATDTLGGKPDGDHGSHSYPEEHPPVHEGEHFGIGDRGDPEGRHAGSLRGKRAALAIRGHHGSCHLEGVITSYSIHYTKLYDRFHHGPDHLRGWRVDDLVTPRTPWEASYNFV